MRGSGFFKRFFKKEFLGVARYLIGTQREQEKCQ